MGEAFALLEFFDVTSTYVLRARRCVCRSRFVQISRCLDFGSGLRNVHQFSLSLFSYFKI